MRLDQKLQAIVSQLKLVGMRHVVVSPGSRNAPLVAAFLKESHFELHSFPDERSAAFAAMGMCQSTQKPCGFVCTSGTALVNAFPAVCEAYYQRMPLYVISADRPEEWIDQWDGQTIRQQNIFGSYVRKFKHLNAREIHSTKELKLDLHNPLEPSGPVHLNIALSEPIYEGISGNISIPTETQYIATNTHPRVVTEVDLPFEVNHQTSLLILIGQQPHSEGISILLKELTQKVPVLSDVCSGQFDCGIQQWDGSLLSGNQNPSLIPDILVTLGTATLSKSLKSLLREHKPRKHYHVSEYSEIGDPFQTQPEWIQSNEVAFLSTLNKEIQSKSKLLEVWTDFVKTNTLNTQNWRSPFQSEFYWVKSLMSELSKKDILQLGNSMTIRYASWAGTTKAKIYSNRGVNGIDGSLSTAVGYAKSTPQQTVFVVLGDISAIYDSNALWTDLPDNIRIAVINNGGGRIFDWIDGPNQFEKLRKFIHTPHQKSLESLAKFYGIDYAQFKIEDIAESINALVNAPEKSRLIELRIID